MNITATRTIPDSILPQPNGTWKRAEYLFWKNISPFYISGQKLLLTLHIIHHHGRQEYILGKLKPEKNIDALLTHLESQGFGNHFIAWTDQDQVFSLRKLVDFDWQYHLRAFSDGEIRGHFEYTPESHPWWHLREVKMEQRTNDFMQVLEGWIDAPIQGN